MPAEGLAPLISPYRPCLEGQSLPVVPCNSRLPGANWPCWTPLTITSWWYASQSYGCQDNSSEG